MILRRVTQHVKDQNWFAVALDFLIVVVGVFIGLQVANWNEARQTQEAATQYEMRLRLDLKRDALNYVYLREYYQGVLKAADTAYDGLTGRIEISDADLLVAAYRASQYNWAERHRATFDELVASGNLDLIEDRSFRTRVTAYYTMSLLEETSQASMNSEYRRAFRMLAPPDLHAALGAQCGDREDDPARDQVFTIDYDCSFAWPSDEIARYARLVRDNEELLALLRLRIANLNSREFELDGNYDYYGLDDFLKYGDTP